MPAPRSGCSCSERFPAREAEKVSCGLPRSVVERIHNGVARAGEMQCREAATVWQGATTRRAGVTLHTRGSEDPSAEVGRCAERGARANPPPGATQDRFLVRTPNLRS